jgi:hypothetical protein
MTVSLRCCERSLIEASAVTRRDLHNDLSAPQVGLRGLGEDTLERGWIVNKA